MNERTQDTKASAQATPTNDAAPAATQQPGASMVHAMIAGGQHDPAAIAAVMQRNPGAKAEIVSLLHQALGNGFVQAVLSVVAPGVANAVASATGGEPGPMRVTAHGLHVRSSPNKTSDDNIVGTLDHHEVVKATGRSGEWVGIEHAKPAFVFGEYLEPITKPAAPAHLVTHPAAPAAAAAPTTAPAAPTVAPAAPTAAPAAPTAAPAAPTITPHHDATPPPIAPAAAALVALHHDPAPASVATAAAAPVGVDPAHVAAEAPKDHKHKGKHTKEIDPKQPFSHSGGDKTSVALTKLHDAGKLKISASQIAQLQGMSEVETGGFAASVDTTDDQVVSIGFEQVVLGHKSLETIMNKVPASFAKHGLEIDTSKNYDFASKPHQIKGVPHQDELRGREWGMKFYAASAEPEVIAAIAEFALGEMADLNKDTAKAGAHQNLFDDDTARAWILELHNNRPAYTPHALKVAVQNGAESEKNRDKFLDILGAAIVDTYETKETHTVYEREKHAYLKKHKTTEVAPDKDAELLEHAKAAVRQKGTNIITKISRHTKLPTLAAEGSVPAPMSAATPATPTAPQVTVAPPLPAPALEHHDAAPAAPVAHHTAHAQKHAGAPAVTPVVAPAHHDAKPAAPAQAHHDEPIATKPHVEAPAHHEPVAAPATTHAAASPTNPNNHVDTAADVFSAVYQAGADKHTQSTQVYVSPGGLTSNTPDVFLFFHGHVAQYNIDPDQKQKSVAYKNGTEMNTLISGKDVAADAMTHARGKNTVCILPQGVVGSNHGGTHEGGYMEAIQAGLPSFMASVLGQLAKDIKLADPNKPLTPGHLSIAGHSAGGYEGVSSALNHAKDKTGDLYDTISDITLMDTGYGEPAHFRQARDWMFQGKPGKNVRIIAQGGQLDNQEQGYHQVFDRKALAAACASHKGFTFEDLAWNDKPTKETRVMQHSRILKDGAPHAEVLVTKYWDPTGMTHHNLRDHVMDDAVLSIGEGQKSDGKEFGNSEFGRHDHGVLKDAYETDGAPHVEAPAAAKPKKEEHKVATKPAHVETVKPTPPPVAAASKHDDHPKHESKPAAPATQGGEVQSTHEHKAGHYDRLKGGVDSFGNQTDSTRANARGAGDASHVFNNSFTTINKNVTLYTSADGDEALSETLPMHARLHVVKVQETEFENKRTHKHGVTARAQIVTPEITADRNIWINFQNLGGKPDPSAIVPFGNELTDVQDKKRADAIRGELPSVCRPGESKFKWKFGANFLPSFHGTALDAGLMSKVNALMNWAIANDMVTDDIVIGEGMRDPRHAHWMSVRFWIARGGMKMIDKSQFAKLKDGKDGDGNLWYKPGWTDDDIIANAEALYTKFGGSGKVAAEGYNFGDPRRAPMNLDSGQGVSAHCSGHAVDVGIPWRNAKDPKETDLWGWEEIYHQFGLTRPLHKDKGGDAKMQEHWHVEETGKKLSHDD